MHPRPLRISGALCRQRGASMLPPASNRPVCGSNSSVSDNALIPKALRSSPPATSTRPSVSGVAV